MAESKKGTETEQQRKIRLEKRRTIVEYGGLLAAGMLAVLSLFTIIVGVSLSSRGESIVVPVDVLNCVITPALILSAATLAGISIYSARR